MRSGLRQDSRPRQFWLKLKIQVSSQAKPKPKSNTNRPKGIPANCPVFSAHAAAWLVAPVAKVIETHKQTVRRLITNNAADFWHLTSVPHSPLYVNYSPKLTQVASRIREAFVHSSLKNGDAGQVLIPDNPIQELHL